MTSVQSIIDQIEREDRQPYLNSIYQNELPEAFVEQFRIAMMYLPPAAHQISMSKINEMSLRRPDEVTVEEVGIMINVIFSIPFVSMYQSLEEGIEKTKVFEKIKVEYNKSTSAFERRMEAKKDRLVKLSGIGDQTIKMNGLHKK